MSFKPMSICLAYINEDLNILVKTAPLVNVSLYQIALQS